MLRDVNSKGTSYFGQFGILLGLTGGGLVIGSLVAAIVWMSMTGGAMPLKSADILQPKYYKVDMVMQVVSTFFIFFAPVYAFAMICYHNPSKFLGFNLRFNSKQFFVVLGILLFTFPLGAALAELNQVLPIPMNWKHYFKGMETEREAQEAALIQLNSVSKYLFSILVIAFLPALFEETFFRSGIQNILVRWIKKPWVAIVLTAIIFSLVHLSYYGFLVRFALGIILGVIYYYSGSLWLNVLLHFLFNGVQLTALYFSDMKKDIVKADVETHFPWWAGVFALAIVVYLLMYFIKISKAHQATYPPDDIDQEDNWLGDIS
jgi:uncharacterized protein